MKNFLRYWLPLTITLALLWWVLSGHKDWLFLVYATFSVCVSLAFAYRANFASTVDQSILRLFKFVLYFPWLLWQIALSNIDVSRRILSGNDSISPVMFELPISLNTEHGRTVFAQSITLTPGTVTVLVYHEKVIVHALSHDGMDGLRDGSFEKPALWYEGSIKLNGQQNPTYSNSGKSSTPTSDEAS